MSYNPKRECPRYGWRGFRGESMLMLMLVLMMLMLMLMWGCDMTPDQIRTFIMSAIFHSLKGRSPRLSYLSIASVVPRMLINKQSFASGIWRRWRCCRTPGRLVFFCHCTQDWCSIRVLYILVDPLMLWPLDSLTPFKVSCTTTSSPACPRGCFRVSQPSLKCEYLCETFTCAPEFRGAQPTFVASSHQNLVHSERVQICGKYVCCEMLGDGMLVHGTKSGKLR